MIESRVIHGGHAAGTVIRCGLIDTMLADLPASVVFFFESALNADRLAEGLARALALIPAFGGRLRTRQDALEIVCDDAGVPMVVADVDETLSEAIGRMTLPGSGFVDHVTAMRARSGGDPLFTVRVSRLAGGGTAVGCSWHHAVGDFQSFMIFMRAWSAAVAGTELPAVHLVQDRDGYLDSVLPAEDSGRPSIRVPEGDDAVLVAREIEMAFRANRTVQVYFGAAEVDRMRAEFSAAVGRRLSMNDVLCAHLVATIQELTESREARYLTMVVNIRRRLELPASVLGNLVSEVHLPCPAGSTAEQLAGGIRAAVDAFGSGPLNLRANRAFLEKIGRDRLGDCVPNGFDPVNRTLMVSNWSRFGTYDIVFEGHRPVLFCPTATLQLPWVSWLVEGFDNAGFLLTLVVPARLAGQLRTAGARARVHRFRQPQDVLSPLAEAARRMI